MTWPQPRWLKPPFIEYMRQPGVRCLIFTGLIAFCASAKPCESNLKYKKTIPMNFVYGQGKALPKDSRMKAQTTFEAILLGERTSTSRKDDSLGGVKVGDLLRFTRSRAADDGEIFARVVAKRTLDGVSPKEWASLEGYDLASVEANWTQGKKFSAYKFQIIYEVEAYRETADSEVQTKGFPRHPALKLFSR